MESMGFQMDKTGAWKAQPRKIERKERAPWKRETKKQDAERTSKSRDKGVGGERKATEHEAPASKNPSLYLDVISLVASTKHFLLPEAV